MTAKETLQQAITDLGITVKATFVPWSKSRSYKEGATVRDRSLNWTITLKRDDHEILTTDYTAGIGNAPSYAARITADVEKALIYETEHGKRARYLPTLDIYSTPGKAIDPDPCDVIYCLASDADVIDHPSFESWASDLGYDTDSRAAEQTYRACLETALKLRAALGDEGLTKLRNACEGY